MPDIAELLKYFAIPGAISAIVALWFAWERIGTKVGAFYTFTVSAVSANRISHVVLINRKNKPVVVFGIIASTDSLLAPVETFDPPLVLKPLEAVRIETKPFSDYVLEDSRYDPRFWVENTTIYLLLERRVLKCKLAHRGAPDCSRRLRRLRALGTTTRTFNGIVYNGKALYAVSYCKTGSGIVNTALILSGGLIHGDWPWEARFNALRAEDLRSADTVRTALAQLVPEGWSFVVDRLEQPPFVERPSARV